MPGSRWLAILALVGACSLWGLSFPLIKALTDAQLRAVPGSGSWFIASWMLCLRFAIAAAVLVLVLRRHLLAATAGERLQAGGLSVLTAGGMLLQMDALAYAPASTVAFITQAYCIQIPLVIALRHRRLPHWSVGFACVLVMAGIAVLAGFDPRTLSLGRGEWETIAAATVFTAQILWLERPRFAGNDVWRMSALTFAGIAALLLPVALLAMPEPSALVAVWPGRASLACLLVLALGCTLVAQLLMFGFQRRVGAVAAGITYCSEPLFASAAALVLPGLLSPALGIAYADETVTTTMVVGGLLILAAVLLVQWRGTSTADR